MDHRLLLDDSKQCKNVAGYKRFTLEVVQLVGQGLHRKGVDTSLSSPVGED